MSYEVVHVPDKERFEIEVDGVTAYAAYHIYKNYMNIVRVLVPQVIEGKGFASALVKAAYEYTKEHNIELRATCSYAAAWLMRHPEKQ